MEKSVTTWNYRGLRLATGLIDGTIAIFDTSDPASSFFTSNCKFKVWQMEWGMSGMTLATSGTDGRVRLWQSNFNGVWDEQAVIEPANITT
ncbi:hypothetical protein L1987_56202 [Smallanthus sonchifolius]|uniref:Uncharacterized protein n=1 Tax=Smallanthus sonchifolius TaxID=185202 RepID=A0ACB9EC53_9ASTR|nr:hypothetical protein L1987_56202 [Smallanthus sonchifolius]